MFVMAISNGPPREIRAFHDSRIPPASWQLENFKFREVIINLSATRCRFRPLKPRSTLTRGYNAIVPSERSLKPKEYRRSELRNPASKNLDRLSALQIVRLMNREDRKVAAAVGRALPAIARAVDAIVKAIRNGGRLIYVGAGSSGRIAVLDAAECPPTFGTSPKLVQALIAGGHRAITSAVEGAEDSPANAERDLRAIKLARKDVLAGICASGTTPYVLSALRFASKQRAGTIAITVNRNTPVARLADTLIATDVGPEVLTGSTRLKSGTAQKMVLNMLTTAAMARLGHVYENLMIDVQASNRKVSQRKVRILADASGKSLSAAEHALRQSEHHLRVALVMLKLQLNAKQAAMKLRAAKGNLRATLGE
jgi:N-acetylmuramic acid 6-phosphate etherase